MYDIIIIGAGPAGLTAAIYAKRARKKVLVLEAEAYGGQIINTLNIENYPAAPHIDGYTFATNTYNQAIELGAEVKFEKVINLENGNVKKVITTSNTYETKSIIIATGCGIKKLNLDNEDKFIGRGISYCATCDGAFYKGKEVAIVGGGNTALEDALYLSDIASKVYLIHRRDSFRGEDDYYEKLKLKDNVEFIFNSNVAKLFGNDYLEAIEIIDKDNNKKNVSISGLFVAIGRIPENANFSKLIDINESGYVNANENCKTNIEGIFVAGDCRVKTLRQLVTATSDGAVAATEAIKYINKNK